MASSLQNLGKIPELRRRLLYTLALLAVYRIGVFVTTPGVNRAVMTKIINQASGSFLGLFNMFSGGALEQMSIFALGIMPYISASIILQLLTVVVPKLEQIQREGELGRRRLNQYTRYGCVVLSLVQSFFIARWLIANNTHYAQFGEVVPDPGWHFYLITMISLTTGTAFIMWLGEQVTERGIGNGISLIIFAGIVTEIPSAIFRLVQKAQGGEITVFALAVIALIVVLVVAGIIFFERGQRRIPVQYAKRVVGRQQFGGQSTHLPLKVNTAGVQPWDKYRLLRMLLKQENPDLAIIFCRTKHGAEKLAKKLHFDGIECREIHGNLAQNKRERVMKGFRGGKFDVLVATDLASRGIDVADISHIINYDIPEDPEAYVHRVGRTARMGAAGKAFTFVGKDQGDELTKVENLINMVIPVATVEGFEPRPTPDDWTETKPSDMPAPSKPIVSRFERPYGSQGATVATADAAAASAPVTLRPRTLGSKIPINRRHKRRR